MQIQFVEYETPGQATSYHKNCWRMQWDAYCSILKFIIFFHILQPCETQGMILCFTKYLILLQAALWL